VIREVIEKAGGGIFVPHGDAAAFSEAVLVLEKDRERAESMGRAAREYVVEHFDRNEQAEEFIGLIFRLGRIRKD
jgi:glycosyltransferase involved in cell wall biosynthesis